jgi:type I restriction enzyme S subunit
METMLEKIDLNNLDKSNWESFRFEEITNRVAEGVDPKTTTLEKYVGLEHIDADNIHIKRFGTPDDVSGGKLKCYPGNVIFGKRRAYQRKAAIVNFEGVCSAHAFVFRANPEVIDPKLFPFFLHSDQFMHRAIDISVGGLSPTINWGDLKGQEFLLPPKAEQARLAELLWAMDELIEKEKVALEKLENLKLSFVKFEIFEKSVNERIDFVKLGDIFDIKTGNKNAEDSVKDGIYPFFTRSIDTQRIDTYNYDQEALILPGEGNFQIKYCSGKFDVHQRTYILSKKTDSEINLKLYRDIVQAKVGELVQKSVGSTVDSLRKPIIENIKVPFLSINKQKNLLEQSSIQDANISNFKMKLSASQSLQKGLINQIF